MSTEKNHWIGEEFMYDPMKRVRVRNRVRLEREGAVGVGVVSLTTAASTS